jgi:hypothetical protein
MKKQSERPWGLLALMLLSASILSVLPSDSSAKDRILDGPAAIAWLTKNDYIDRNRIPLHNFMIFRSQTFGGGAGPHGLKAIMASGWSLSGPLTQPIGEPIVIVIDDSVVPRDLKGRWRWMNGADVNCSGSSTSGSCTASNGFSGSWRYLASSDQYEITWTKGSARYVDTVSISLDGKSLSGRNQHGASISASKK